MAFIAKASRFQGYSKCLPAYSVGGYNEFFDEITLSQSNQGKRLRIAGRRTGVGIYIIYQA